MPADGSLLALLLWALGIGLVAWCWEQIEERLLERSWRRDAAKRAWDRWDVEGSRSAKQERAK